MFGVGTFKRWNPSQLLSLPARRTPWIKPIKLTNRLICTAISSLLLQVHTSTGSHVRSEVRPTHCGAFSGLLQSQTVQNVAVAVEEDLTEDELLLGLLSCMDSVCWTSCGVSHSLHDHHPPSKTFSAEATSEHVKRLLYIAGVGDLGTHASNLDPALECVLNVATMWKAIVLIDEVGTEPMVVSSDR